MAFSRGHMGGRYIEWVSHPVISLWSPAHCQRFLKVVEAKRLLETGEVDTVHLATRRVGISRSAFYKYKDAVRPFNDMLHGRIVTFQFLL